MNFFQNYRINKEQIFTLRTFLICLVFLLFQFSLITNFREDIDLKNSFSSFTSYSKELQNNEKVYIKKGDDNVISFSEYSYTERHKEPKIVRDILKPTQVFTIYAYGSDFDDFASKDIFYGIIEDKNLGVIRLVDLPEGSTLSILAKFLLFFFVIIGIFTFFLWRDLVEKVTKNSLSHTSSMYDKDSLVSLYREIASNSNPSLLLQSAYLVKISEQVLEKFLTLAGYHVVTGNEVLRPLIQEHLDDNFILNKKLFQLTDEGIEKVVDKQVVLLTYGVLYMLKNMEKKKDGKYTTLYQTHKSEFDSLGRKFRVYRKSVLDELLDSAKVSLESIYARFKKGKRDEEVLFSTLIFMLVIDAYSKEKFDFFYWISLLFNPINLILILVKKVYSKL